MVATEFYHWMNSGTENKHILFQLGIYTSLMLHFFNVISIIVSKLLTCIWSQMENGSGDDKGTDVLRQTLQLFCLYQMYGCKAIWNHLLEMGSCSKWINIYICMMTSSYAYHYFTGMFTWEKSRNSSWCPWLPIQRQFDFLYHKMGRDLTGLPVQCFSTLATLGCGSWSPYILEWPNLRNTVLVQSTAQDRYFQTSQDK